MGSNWQKSNNNHFISPLIWFQNRIHFSPGCMVLAMDVVVAFLGSWLQSVTQALVMEEEVQSLIPKCHFSEENAIPL